MHGLNLYIYIHTLLYIHTYMVKMRQRERYSTHTQRHKHLYTITSKAPVVALLLFCCVYQPRASCHFKVNASSRWLTSKITWICLRERCSGLKIQKCGLLAESCQHAYVFINPTAAVFHVSWWQITYITNKTRWGRKVRHIAFPLHSRW